MLPRPRGFLPISTSQEHFRQQFRNILVLGHQKYLFTVIASQRGSKWFGALPLFGTWVLFLREFSFFLPSFGLILILICSPSRPAPPFLSPTKLTWFATGRWVTFTFLPALVDLGRRWRGVLGRRWPPAMRSSTLKHLQVGGNVTMLQQKWENKKGNLFQG